MPQPHTRQKVVLISRIATLVIFLALIRCIGEAFRLDSLSAGSQPFSAVKPFQLGAMVAAVALLGMTVLSYFNKHIPVILLAVLTIAALVTIKLQFGIS